MSTCTPEELQLSQDPNNHFKCLTHDETVGFFVCFPYVISAPNLKGSTLHRLPRSPRSPRFSQLFGFFQEYVSVFLFEQFISEGVHLLGLFRSISLFACNDPKNGG
jgi:hypothetical protein